MNLAQRAVGLVAVSLAAWSTVATTIWAQPLFVASVSEHSPRIRPHSTSPGELDAMRRAYVWNSPDMVEARQWVREYYQTSKQRSAAEAETYLARLEQSSAHEMQDWLTEFQQMRYRLQSESVAIGQTRRGQIARRQSIDQMHHVSTIELSRRAAGIQAQQAAIRTRPTRSFAGAINRLDGLSSSRRCQ